MSTNQIFKQETILENLVETGCFHLLDAEVKKLNTLFQEQGYMLPQQEKEYIVQKYYSYKRLADLYKNNR